MRAGSTSISVLVENTVDRRGLIAEHGLAFWIEGPGRRVLFDTGQGMALTHNAAALKIDLSSADAVVLSHGHYDHTGGLLAALPSFAQATVYAHLTAFRDRFTQGPDGVVRPVRSPIESFDWLSRRVGRTVPVLMQPVELGARLWATGQIPRENDFEDPGGAFYLDAGCTQPDTLVDDQAVYMETPDGVVVLLGCAHAGVVNTLDRVCSLAGVARIHAVYGGMHLLHAGSDRLERTIRRLRELDVRHIGLAHCTGFHAMCRLSRELPDACVRCVTGTRFECP